MSHIDTNLFEIKKVLGLIAEPEDRQVEVKKLSSLDSAEHGSLAFCTDRLKSKLSRL